MQESPAKCGRLDRSEGVLKNFTKFTGKHLLAVSFQMYQKFDWLNSLRFLKTDVTKKLISQELRHISPSCKKYWKAYYTATITLPLASYEQSFSIFHQSSPSCKVSAQVLPPMATRCLSKAWETIYQWNLCLDHF